MPAPMSEDAVNHMRGNALAKATTVGTLRSHVLELADAVDRLRSLLAGMTKARVYCQEQYSDLEDKVDERESLLSAAEAVCESCRDLLDAFWDMSPLQYAATRDLPHMSDEVGEQIKTQARKRLEVYGQFRLGCAGRPCFNCEMRPRTHGQLCKTCNSGAEKLLGKLFVGGADDAS